MRPASSYRTHSLRFLDVNESLFVGGGMVPLDSDVGLWVVDEGALEAVGTQRKAWTRLVKGASAGQSHMRCDNIAGWEVGDRVVIGPTAPAGSANDSTWNVDGCEERVITGFPNGSVSFDAPLDFQHPIVDGRFAPEVVN
jgi:hypothetical protein